MPSWKYCVLCRWENNIRRPSAVGWRGAFQVAPKGKQRHGSPLSFRPVRRLRSALRDGPGRDGGSPPTSNPLSATAGPQHFSQLWTAPGTCEPGSWGTSVPGSLQVTYCTGTCSELACTTTAPQRKRGTVTLLFLARAPIQPTLGPFHCSLKELQSPSFLPSHRIASHHAARTHPRSPTCCVVNAAQGRTVCSLALELGPSSHSLHRITPSPLYQQSASWRVASLTTHLLTAPSTWPEKL